VRQYDAHVATEMSGALCLEVGMLSRLHSAHVQHCSKQVHCWHTSTPQLRSAIQSVFQVVQGCSTAPASCSPELSWQKKQLRWLGDDCIQCTHVTGSDQLLLPQSCTHDQNCDAALGTK